MLSEHDKSDKLAERSSGPGCTASILGLMDVGVEGLIRDGGSYLWLWLVFPLAEPVGSFFFFTSSVHTSKRSTRKIAT